MSTKDWIDPKTLADRAESLRNDALLDGDVSAMPPMAEQYYLLALSALEQAERFAKLADYNLMQGR